MPCIYTEISRPNTVDDPQWFDVCCDFSARRLGQDEFDIGEPFFFIDGPRSGAALQGGEIAALLEWWQTSETQAKALAAARDTQDDFGDRADSEYEKRRDERDVGRKGVIS